MIYLIIAIILIAVILSCNGIIKHHCKDCKVGRLKRNCFDKQFDKYVLQCDKCFRLYTKY